MNGLKYLLDANFVLGMMKREPAVLSQRQRPGATMFL